MATLQEIRDKLLAQQAKQERAGSNYGDKTVYPFWNIPDNGSSELRFLPDGNANNTFFWTERLMIRLPFEGIKGESDQPITIAVPCMEMYNETCPILAETRPWWKDESLVEMARKYWKKKSYIFQGFVTKDGLNEKEVPENPIRKFIINPSIFEIIKSSLMDPEMEDLPTDYENGRDFRLNKTKKGKYADYSTSKWSMKTRPLSETELAAVANFGLVDLKTYLPKKPGADELEAIKDMFKASVDGEAYDPEKWGKFYKPSNYRVSDDEVATEASEAAKLAAEAPTTVTTAKPVDALARLRAASSAKTAAKSETEETTEAPAKKPDASEILRMIREKSAAKS